MGTLLASIEAGDRVDERRTFGAVMSRLFAGTADEATRAAVHGLVEIGRYELRERLGQGGTGIVHAAWDPRLSRDVAIKLLRDGRGQDPLATEARARLLREAR